MSPRLRMFLGKHRPLKCCSRIQVRSAFWEKYLKIGMSAVCGIAILVEIFAWTYNSRSFQLCVFIPSRGVKLTFITVLASTWPSPRTGHIESAWTLERSLEIRASWKRAEIVLARNNRVTVIYHQHKIRASTTWLEQASHRAPKVHEHGVRMPMWDAESTASTIPPYISCDRFFERIFASQA